LSRWSLLVLLSLAACDKISSQVAAWKGTAVPTEVDAGPPPVEEVDAGPPVPAAPPDDGLKAIRVEVHGPLEKELVATVGKEVAAPLSLVITRLTLWWMDPKDARTGDVIQVLYELPPGKEPLVRALRYHSNKFSKDYEAVYYQAESAPFGRYFQPDGSELEQRLKDGPLDTYEQVTSFLKDGRHHHGVDFKTPVGTPVHMPFDGTLEKKNWNWKSNGNCLQFLDPKTGRHALFLHLSVVPDSLKIGATYKKGTEVAKTGNTGHTTAPHLHYQLEGANKAVILDPFKIHELYRDKVDPAQMGNFQREATRLTSRLPK
jgi:murein DD-endopeptidase MepM/ murein hydrolase activator NlpD